MKVIQRLFISCLLAPSLSFAQSPSHSLQKELVVASSGIPWGMVWLPSGDLLYTLRTGQLMLLIKDKQQAIKINGLPKIAFGGQGGLLDITLHPDYSNNGWIYLSYTKEDEQENKSLAVIRAKLQGNQLMDITPIYTAQAYDDGGRHFGGRLTFDNQGYLYFSIGDRADRDVNPQDITRDAGKIYRVKDDGGIPADNPFVKQADAKHAIYSFGHRNPQGLVKNPKTGAIWSHEHGPRGGDEVNLILKGENYGWPVVSHGVDYIGFSFTDLTEKEGMVSPLWDWTPSIAPSGMDFISSERYPGWQGKLVVGSLKFGQLLLLSIEGNKVTGQQVIKDGLIRVRNVKQGPDGYLYVALDGQGIYRLRLE